jgi:hypothetical protein
VGRDVLRLAREKARLASETVERLEALFGAAKT